MPVPMPDDTDQSLSSAVDRVNDAFFYQQPLSRTVRHKLATLISARRGLAGAYAGTFALYPEERANGIRVFTGERLTSASARHVLGEEATRALLLLNVPDAPVVAALKQATEGLSSGVLAVADSSRQRGQGGVFCCGKCSVSLWRHLGAGGLDHRDERLAHGLRHLSHFRDGEGGWRAFPFYYTVLTLTEIDLPQARAELKYAAPGCERKLRRKPPSETYARRRHDVMERALTRQGLIPRSLPSQHTSATL